MDEVRKNQKQIIKDGTAFQLSRPMFLDGSNSKGKTMQKKNGKRLLRSFNSECEAAINKVTYSNFDRIRSRVGKSFEQLNKLNDSNDVRLSSTYLDSKVDALRLTYEYE